ncbi:hypothetical protein SAMN04488522_101105 [Pedobacter caeni]|uniref:Uncharacterized protein n=2 Tax=Pedobacter caeni TaxID=288992 RepID=A0A1M4T7J4_9SPHI|nr:hypothetical protein SAMN04488522_101105 [Pedobacter caeni]
MSERILILASPWTTFNNHLHHRVLLLASLLETLSISYQVIFPGLELASPMGSNADEPYKTMLNLIENTEEYTDIWLVQDSQGAQAGDFNHLLSLISSTCPASRLLFFSNSTTRVRPDIPNLSQNLINFDTMSTMVSVYDSQKPLCTQLLKILPVADQIPSETLKSNKPGDLKVCDLNFFTKQYRARYTGEEPIGLPVFLDHPQFDVVTQVFSLAERYHSLDFNLGFVDLDDSCTYEKVSEIAQTFADIRYSFHFHCELPENCNMELLQLLKDARINSVTILNSAENISQQDIYLKNLQLLNRVKRLHGLEIQVSWQLYAASSPDEEWNQFIEGLPLFFGFPAPNGLFIKTENNEKALHRSHIYDYISAWQAHSPEANLSKGQGPNFSKLFDKRGSLETWRFLNFNRLQSELYGYMDDIVDLEELKQRMIEISPEKIDNFITFLKDQQVVISLNNRYFLNASQRRTFTQVWATAEL